MKCTNRNSAIFHATAGTLSMKDFLKVTGICTGERDGNLSGQERGRKAADAFLDALTLASGIKASGVGKIFSRKALAFTGKTVAVDLVANKNGIRRGKSEGSTGPTAADAGKPWRGDDRTAEGS